MTAAQTMKWLRLTGAGVAIGMCVLTGAMTGGKKADAQTCIDPSLPLSVEEARLSRVLPGHTLPAPVEILREAAWTSSDRISPPGSVGCAVSRTRRIM